MYSMINLWNHLHNIHQDEIYLNLVLEYIPETVYKVKC